MFPGSVAIYVSTSGGCQMIDVTSRVSSAIRESGVSDGICHVYVPHTTAGVTINENADPDVRSDILMALSRIVPEDVNYRHAEGNSPAHLKALLTGSSVSVMVDKGMPVLGRWQGIYFCEFDGPRSRKFYLKVMGA